MGRRTGSQPGRAPTGAGRGRGRGSNEKQAEGRVEGAMETTKAVACLPSSSGDRHQPLPQPWAPQGKES